MFQTPGSSRTLPLRFLIAAALVGVLVRLAFGLGYWTDKPLTRDETEYLSLARSLAAGHGFVYDEVMKSGSFEPFGRPPGYPAFLALVGGGRDVATAVPVSVKVAQSFVGGLGVLMVGVIATGMAGAPAGRAAALLAAVYPPLAWISAYALSEALFWPIGLAGAWLFDRILTKPRAVASASHRAGDMSAAWGAACGLVIGVGILIRPALVLFLPVAGLLLLYRRQVPGLAALALGVLVVVGPWTARNYVHHGRLMFVASEGGVTFWTGNHPLATGDGDMAAQMPIKLDNQRLRAEHPGLSEEELEPIYYREALAWIRANPADWIALEFRKLFHIVVPVGPSYTLHSTRYYAASVMSYLTVLLLAVFGLARLGRSRTPTPGLWILAGSAILVSLVFFPQERFRIPILDPTLVILAGTCIASMLARRRPA